MVQKIYIGGQPDVGMDNVPASTGAPANDQEAKWDELTTQLGMSLDEDDAENERVLAGLALS